MQPEPLRHQQIQAKTGHMQQEHSYEQDAKKPPAAIKDVQNSQSVMNCIIDIQTYKIFTSPEISMGKAAKDSIISQAEIATVFLSTATSPML